jgi:hypothetical protein
VKKLREFGNAQHPVGDLAETGRNPDTSFSCPLMYGCYSEEFKSVKIAIYKN